MKTFHKRPGTTSKGTDYENLNIANFVLQLVSNPNIEDFHLSSNEDGYGAFDDIIVELQYECDQETYALQLKHKDKQTLALESLKQNRGDFGIVKYFESFQKCKGASQKFILFTNLKFEVKDNKPFRLEGEDFYVTLSKVFPKDVFKISEQINYCYKFNIVEDTSTFEDSGRIRQYKTFFDTFFLYVDQENVKDVKVRTEKKFTEMFLSNREEFEKYLNIISEWSQQEGKKEKLNKKWMQRAIVVHLLSSRTKPLSFGVVNENRKILRQAISDFDIAVFEKNTHGKVSGLWGDAKEKIEDFKEINRRRTKYQLSSSYIDNLDNVEPKLLSQLLWIMGKCPLIVKEDQTVYRAIQLCLKEKFIVLGKDLIKEWQKHFSVFQDLSDLQRESNVYKDLMKNFTCSLQGKKEVNLYIFSTENEKVLNLIKTDDLLEMLDGPCNIGGEKEILPEPYIDRFLLPNVIDIRYLEKINEDTLIILNCGNRLEDLKRKLRLHKFIDIDDYLSECSLRYEENINEKGFELEDVTNLKTNLEVSSFGSPVYISKDECNLAKFQATFAKHKDAKICHQFRYRDDGNLDWIRSKNDVSRLENYKMFNEFVEENTLWSSQPDNNVNLIIGDPGMGKTELMKSLKNNSFSVFWTLVLYPKDMYLFFKNLENRNNLVEAFEEFVLIEKLGTLKILDKEIFKTSVKQNRVIYVWDALDEISSIYLENVTRLILLLSERHLQWVTSRHHLKKFLETKFNVLSITINQFNENEQKFYIRKRLAASSKEESEEIINKIQSAFTLVEHKDVLGIPLQIFMLTELFRQNKDKYLDLLNSVFALTDLYRYFVEEKTNIYYKEKAGVDPQNFQSQILVEELKVKMLETYEKFALKALFPEDILKRLNVTCETELQSFQTSNSSIGIITEITNEIPRFLHASFAEYLAAVYFSKHLGLEDIILDIIFQQKYVNIRFFFDLLLAKTCPSHIALLYKDFNFLRQCDMEMLKSKDIGGRSVLHLACSWGKRYPLLNVKKSGILEKSYIIDDVNDSGVTAEAAEYLDMVGYLAHECNIWENDKLFNMTPLSYGQKSDCLFAKLKIFEQQKTQLSSFDNASINILYYSARFGYSNALDLFIVGNLPFIKTKQMEYSLLHLACGHKDYILKLLKTKNYKNKINYKDSDSDTSLFLAAYNNYHETAATLIKYGAQVNVRNKKGFTPLYTASGRGHEKIVEILTKSGVDINLALDNGATPLFIASQEGLEKIVEILTESGADINLAGDDGATPLHIASQSGHEKIVEILTKSGADINLAMDNGATPLYIASQNGHEKIVEILTKSGADINLAINDGPTPLYIASQNGLEKIVEILTKSEADINLARNDGATPLYIASQSGHEKIVEILTKSAADINLAMDDGATPLHIASQSGHEKIVEILTKSGADINLAMDNGATPLFIASQNEHEKIVEILTKSGADINLAMDVGATPLYIASQNGHEKIVEILTKSGADINLAADDGATPLFIASQVGHEKIVEILTKSGADINLAGDDGATPLHIASQSGHEKIVEILTKSGVDINLAMDDGATPHYIASHNGHEKIVEILTKSGVDINLAKNNGVTPLFIASQNGHEKIVEILTKSEADINLARNDGVTPLFIASQQGRRGIVELLILSGADVNIARNDGTTPLDIASQNRYTNIVHLLTTSGAKQSAAVFNKNCVLA